MRVGGVTPIGAADDLRRATTRCHSEKP